MVLTGMAQRQRAGLITLRTLDRNELPVFFNLAALKKLLGDIRPLVGLSDIKQSGYGLVVRFNAHLKRDRDS